MQAGHAYQSENWMVKVGRALHTISKKINATVGTCVRHTGSKSMDHPTSDTHDDRQIMCLVKSDHTDISIELNNGMCQALRPLSSKAQIMCLCVSLADDSRAQIAALNNLRVCLCDLGVLGTCRACQDVQLFSRRQ